MPQVRHLATKKNVARAMRLVKPVFTLCGERWVPQEGFMTLPICNKCTGTALHKRLA